MASDINFKEIISENKLWLTFYEILLNSSVWLLLASVSAGDLMTALICNSIQNFSRSFSRISVTITGLQCPEAVIMHEMHHFFVTALCKKGNEVN